MKCELTINGRLIVTTPEHPFHVHGGDWTTAGALVVGMMLDSLDGPPVRLEFVRPTVDAITVHNVTVAESHTYFVGEDTWGWSVWTHNYGVDGGDLLPGGGSIHTAAAPFIEFVDKLSELFTSAFGTPETVGTDTITGTFWTAVAKGDVKLALSILETAASQGVTIAARKGVQAATGILTAIYNNLPAAKCMCDQSAAQVMRAFQAVGQNPQLLRITDQFGAKFFFLADKTTAFAKTGYHMAVLNGGRVYDALTGPQGMLYADYIKMLQKLGVVPVVTPLP